MSLNRSLVTVPPVNRGCDDRVAASAAAHRARANAKFVAHLIAMAVRAPQTRSRRRVEPETATAAYRALGQWPTESGGVVCRSL
jgi:hypothetical protein